MEAMTWGSASTYDNDRKFQDGLSCKSSVGKKKRPMGVGNISPLQKVQEVTIGKIERNPQQQIQKQKEKADLLTIQILSKPLWQWGVLIIQSSSAAFFHKVGNLNKWLHHLLEHLHVQFKS
jgi:hypothetical protein